MAVMAHAALVPHTKSRIDPRGFLLYPDEKHEIPEDVSAKEAKWMMTLNRAAKGGA